MSYLPEPIGKYDAVYYLIEYLTGLKYGVTVEDMAQELNKNAKTIRRYLISIDSLEGIELIKERGSDRRYRYRINKLATPFRPLFLSAEEVVSLYFTRGFAHFRNIPLIHNSLAEVFKKIQVAADRVQKRTGNEFYKRISELFILPRELGGKVYGETDYSDYLNKLIEAAIDYRVCEVDYRSDEYSKKLLIGPLHFFNYRDAIYLLSKNMELSSKYKKNIFTNLALHRVKGVEILDKGYEYPKGLDTKNFFSKNAFNFEDDVFTVVLKFPSQAKNYIAEREWYPNQKLKRLKDGSVLLSFESDINMMLLGWIRSFGPDVEVLEPRELRERVVEDLQQNLGHYKEHEL